MSNVLERWPGIDARELERTLDTIARDAVLKGTDCNSTMGSQATQLVALASDVELFRAPGDDSSQGYVTVPVADHVETWPINSNSFSVWLAHEFYKTCSRVPSSQAVQDAIKVLSGKAVYEGQEQKIAVRLAGDDEEIYLDLADHLWRAVRITKKGWEILENRDLPIRFIRKRGMLPLPLPERGGSIEELRSVINVPNDDAWALLRGYFVSLYKPGGPFPILILNGEQGSAKSSLCRIIRSLVDPCRGGLRRPPKEERDLMIAANNSHIIAYDNLTGLSPSLADAMCSLATGGGFATRQLYTDDEEKIFDAVRPIILNGIDDLANRLDLLDRAICITLPAIPPQRRRDEAALNEQIDDMRARVLGVLLDAVVSAIKRVSEVYLESSPRMADFARFATAAEPALKLATGEFLRVYTENRRDANLLAVESSPIGPVIVDIVAESINISGTATEILQLLGDRAGENAIRQRYWPKNSKAFANSLRRIAPSLRQNDIEVTFHPPRGRDKRREIVIERLQQTGA